VLGLLFLRGAQTAGEIRARSDRMHEFGAIDDVEATLQHLAPLVQEIPRRPGQKEARWTHTLSGSVAAAAQPAPSGREGAAEEAAESGAATAPLSLRVQRLEERVASLTDELRALKAKLGE